MGDGPRTNSHRTAEIAGHGKKLPSDLGAEEDGMPGMPGGTTLVMGVVVSIWP